MTFTLVHEHVARKLDVKVTRNQNIATVRCTASGSFDVRFPGQLRRFVQASFDVKVFVEPITPEGSPPRPGRFETATRSLPLKLTVFTPDGRPFVGDQVSLSDLRRFRDPRGQSHGQWSFSVEGDSGPLEEAPRELKVLTGSGRMNLSVIETVKSKSAAPLVTDTIDGNASRRYTFDLFRVGTFTATARTLGLPVAIVSREMRLIDPDGVQVATGKGKLRFDVDLRTLARSRDAQGRARNWTLEVLAGTGPSFLRRTAVSATVVATSRLGVRAVQSRVDRMLGERGNKLAVFAEEVGNDVKLRLRIDDAESAETIDMHGLLDSVIGSVAQDPGVDRDIRAGVVYTLARANRDLGSGLSLSLDDVRVGTIDIAVGASQEIKPAVPALKIALQVTGEATVKFKGFPLATVKVRGGRIRMEAGMSFEPGVGFRAHSWMNESLVDVDVHWAAAIAAGVLSFGLLALGAIGVTEKIESGINAMLPGMLKGIVGQAVGRAPQMLAMMQGDDFTYRALRLEGNDFVFEFDAPVEPDPKPSPTYTPIIGRAATQLGHDTWRLSPPTLGDTWAADKLAKIDHIVVVMMENRSYDHVLGYRADLPGTAASDGLTPALKTFLQEQGFPLPAMSTIDRIAPNAQGKRTAFPRGVGHDLADVAEQLSAQLTMPLPDGRTINSPKGFVENFRDRAGTLLPEDMLGFYEAGDLPFSAFLAQQYGFSDQYYCAHPGPTLPNRMLSLTGDVQKDRTGAPILDNNDSDNFALSRAPTIYDLLTRFGVSWRIYESFPSVTMLRMFARYATNDTDIVDIGRFAADAKAGTLPALSVVEPAMHHFPQNDDHSSNNTPAVDMHRGQQFLQGIYDALTANPEKWQKTLLLVTYDEHGGFYDHVVPPLAESRASQIDTTDGPIKPVPQNGPIGPIGPIVPIVTTPNKPVGTHLTPAFQVPKSVATPYGLRVPTFVVSPWVPAGMRFNKVQVAWMGNKSGMEAVDRAQGEVFAKVVQPDGGQGYWSIMIVHRDSPLTTLQDVLKAQKSLTLGLGDVNSTSGSLVPGYYAFAQNKVDPQKDFKRTVRANHETNILAVANKQIDVATVASDGIERMKLKQADKAAELKEVWRSPLIPSDPILWRKDLDAETKKKLRDFMLGYGRDSREKDILKTLTFSAFIASDNQQLLPIRQLELARERSKIEADANLSADEKQKKLQDIDGKLDALGRQMASAK